MSARLAPSPDVLLELLADAGVDQADAAWAIDLLAMFVTATVAEHAQDP